MEYNNGWQLEIGTTFKGLLFRLGIDSEKSKNIFE